MFCIIAGFWNTQETGGGLQVRDQVNEADIGFSVGVESLQSENWSAEQLGSI